MTAPQPAPTTPEQQPKRTHRLAAFFKWLLGLIAVAAVAAGAAYGIFWWLVEQKQAALSAELASIQKEQERLSEQVEQVRRAAEEAKLLLTDSGGTTTLDQRIKEIENLRTELETARKDFSQQLKDLEQSMADKMAQQGQATTQTLSQELQWKSLVAKAQGEVLLSQVYWAEGNRGLARDELGTAIQSLQQAAEAAPEPLRSQIADAAKLAEETRGALILEQSSARDSLNLLWHRVSELLALTPTED